jgi:cobyrinic acid a,c-diamide synthase
VWQQRLSLNSDPQVQFAGVVFNRLGSQDHRAFLQEAMAAYVDLPFLGGLVRDNRLCIPERHLGLTTVEDGPLTAGQEDLLVASIEAGLDVDCLLARLPEIPAGSGQVQNACQPDGFGVSRSPINRRYLVGRKRGCLAGA